MVQVNYVAILVAVVVNFFLGYLWYTVLFRNQWAKEMGVNTGTKPDSKVMARGMTLSVVGNFLFAWVLAHNLAAWSYVPGISESGPFMVALNSAFFLWLGFYVPVHLSVIAWENKSWKLFFINGGYHFASLLVVGLILTHWV
jgi:Protein of unknown function (DUF1761)